MKDEESDVSLESLLHGLPLREPADSLDARIEAEFARQRFRPSRRIAIFAMALAAGLLIAVGIGIRLKTLNQARPRSSANAARPGPIQIERDTSTIYDDGMIAGTNDAAYERFRRRTVREIWYIDARTHARALVTIPTEQVMIQKVDAY